MRKEENAEKKPKADDESAAEKSGAPTETAEETEPEETSEEEQLKEAPEEEVEPEEAPAPPEEKEAAPAEEEEKPEREEEEPVEERIYTVPLGKAWIMPANKRAPRAMRMLKTFIKKHMKLEARKETEEEEEEGPNRLIISNEVNLRIWSRGIEKPPRKIRVRAAKDKEGDVTVYLAEGD